MSTSANPETLSHLFLEDLQKELGTGDRSLSKKEAIDRLDGSVVDDIDHLNELYNNLKLSL